AHHRRRRAEEGRSARGGGADPSAGLRHQAVLGDARHAEDQARRHRALLGASRGMTRAAWLGAVIALAGCAGAPLPPPYTPSAPLPGGTAVAFTIPRAADPPGFFDLPWPTELRRRPDGRPDFRGYPGHDTMLFAPYVDAAEEDVDGYALSPAI